MLEKYEIIVSLPQYKSVTEGFFNNGKFYKKWNYTQEIQPKENVLYYDIASRLVFRYKSGYSLMNDSYVLKVAGISWEYPQTDGDGSEPNDNNVLVREVLPERDKVVVNFSSDTTEADLRIILKIRKMEECSFNYYDIREGKRVTRTSYPVSDAIKAKALIDNEFIVEPFELRFVQTIPI